MIAIRPRKGLPAVILSVFLLAGPVAAAEVEDAKPDPLARAKAAMRGRQFARAVKLLDEALARSLGAKEPRGRGGPDEIMYLKALALDCDGKHGRAVAVADTLIKEYADSPWLRKARFLKAAALTRGRNFRAAEAIYAAEANRLLSEARKERTAGVIIKFADAMAVKPDPDDLGAPPPNYAKAYNLYRKALAMEIGRDLTDEVTFKRARTIRLAGNHRQAVSDYRAYLAEFDPDWTGSVGSVTRLSGRKREKPKPAGKHVLEARFGLAEAQLRAGDMRSARVNLEDLLALIAAKPAGERRGQEIPKLIADARWQHVRTFRMPNPPGGELARAVKAARDFCKAHVEDPRAVVAAWWIAKAYQAHGRADQAIAAYEDFIAGTGYKLPPGETATAKLDEFAKSPAAMHDEWRKLALYSIGQIRFGQKEYAKGAKAWGQYVTRYPHGPQWAACQHGIINAEFQVAVDAVADKDYPRARELFDAFLAAHPLDGRARQILFTLGQIDYADAQKLDTDKADRKKITAAYSRAVERWERLVGKYPNTAESSLALYRVGVIHEEKLGDLEKALESYRRLTWGSYASAARARVAVMTRKHLEVRTERKYRTNETPKVHLNVRNIKKLKLKQYYLDLAAYFRKTHAIGRMDALDIDLIQPDKTWEVQIDKYAKYKPTTQDVEIPFEEAAAGVCIINVSCDDLEATTLVIRSDLELILKTSRREALVFVQNMRADAPAAGVELLLSDGKKVFATGATGADGVFRKTFDELKKAATLRVFALSDGSAASNMLSLAGLGLGAGLSRRGYIYTDRPAYQPGQTVKFRGIIRDVKDGSYLAPKGQVYLVSVSDSRGRVLWSRPRTLSEFGTFHTQMSLDERAPLGTYTITARGKDKPEHTYSATFTVQRFKLEKMRLKLTTDRKVYFRGEAVKLTMIAEYYWGQPVAGKTIRYVLPDGRQLSQKTDKAGRLVVTFDTSGMPPGAAMAFQASIEGENVGASHRAFLARLGFGIAVKASQPLALAGEPFDVEITTTTPDGKPTGKHVRLLVLRRAKPKANPVLDGVPWINAPSQPAAEVTVREKKVITDEKTGKATVNLKLAEGGLYVLRATGEDRFEQVVTGQGSVTVSDDLDATKLRFFAATDTLQVGRKTRIRLHSRVKAKLALLTYEGETIIAHKVIPIGKGYNPIDLAVGHEHFPNFRIAVSVMDGRVLRSAAKPFTVQRQLNVTVKPLKDVYLPGQPGKVELTVTDQLGKGVRGELSLAVIDEALLAVYPDTTPKILDFFQRGAHRHAEFRLVSTCGFTYTAVTHKVVKAYKDEAERLARRAEEAKELDKLRRSVKRLEAGARAGNGRRFDHKALREAPAGLDRDQLRRPAPVKGAPGAAPAKPPAARPRDGKKAKAPAAPRPRRELPEAGLWLGRIVTDNDGKAVVELPMPETTTQWRLTARGCTVETLVGETTAGVITRKDFFVEIKAPQHLQEGDSIRVLARVHNLTDFAGPVKLALTVFGGDDLTGTLARKSASVKVGKKGTAEVVLPSVEVPLAAALKIRLAARAGKLADALEMTLPVRPWGLEFAADAGGVARNSSSVELELPKNRKYASKWMSITVGPDLKRSVIEMALSYRARPIGIAAGKWRSCMPPRRLMGSHAGSDLLAVAAAIRYAKAVNAPALEHQRLADRARALVASLVVSQRADGGWAWTGTKANTDWAATAMSFWALCQARDQGLVVHADAIAKAKAYLKSTFTRLSSGDNDAKAVILHALSADGAADFAHANRLHRERNRLSAAALAYTALAFVNLERNEFAGELLDVLDRHAKVGTAGEKKLLHWSASSGHAWLQDDVETTAVAALAMMSVRPASPKVKQAIDYLMHRRGCYGFTPAKARGPAVAAVAAYFAAGKFAAADYRLKVSVNGKDLKTIAATGARATVTLVVPREMLVDGANRVEFRMAGRGEYAYAVTMRGFSSDLRDPGSWRYPYVRHRYYRHAPLEYRGRSIGASSTSPVKNIEIGQRVKVYVDLYGYRSYKNYLVIEEHFPAGMMLVEGTVGGRFVHHEIHAGKVVMYFPPGRSVGDFSYDLIGYATGSYRSLPTVIRDSMHPGRMRIGKAGGLRVLSPGEMSDDPYRMNDSERYALGRLYFNDGLYKEALAQLTPLFDRKHRYNERDVARMLLWIHTAEGFYDARRIVDVFEVLRERYPQLEIPFDKILIVGKAYADIGEFERAYLVFRATIDASFINDLNVSAVLEDEGQFLGSVDYQEDLWREYPDTAQVTSAYFALSQALYQKAPQAHVLAKQAVRLAVAKGDKPPRRLPGKVDMLKEAIRLLSEFLTLYPNNPLADDAAFSMANAFLDLKQYQTVVRLCEAYRDHFTKSEFAGGFQYMVALGHFWQRHHAEALAAAKVVAEGKSKDKDFATYIVAQIHHAEGKPAEAIDWYRKVAGKYPDAKQAIDYFEQKRIALEEVNIFRPGEPVKLKLNYRNITEAALQVYRVDLMKLYLREKNLSTITKVNLAGIKPLLERTISLGDGKDYVDKEKVAELRLAKEGAYLVICRGDDLFASALALVTPLKIEIQEDATAGRVRANVIDAVKKHYVPEVHVKAIGSADTAFRSGETDLRGVFVADNIRGKVTVIARAGDGRYAFHRGDKWLGAPKAAAPRRAAALRSQVPDYQKNLRLENERTQYGAMKAFDSFRRARQSGVQVQQAK